jgi:hypothetical protein
VASIVGALGESTKIADWLAERGGFETAVSRETVAQENLGEYWGNFRLKSAGILERMSSRSVRYDTRPLASGSKDCV